MVNAGDILTADILNDLTEGMKARGVRDSTSSNSTSTTAVGIKRLDNITLVSGKTYTVEMYGHPNSGTVSDNIRREVRYAIGSTATTSSTQLKGSVSFAKVDAGGFFWRTTFTAGTTGYPAAGVASFAFCFARDAGSGTCNFFTDSVRDTGFKIYRDGSLIATGTDM
jgi:hypothetical protein